MLDINVVDVVIIAVVVICICAAILYIRKQKKKGVHCIGCPSAGVCNKKSCEMAEIKNKS